MTDTLYRRITALEDGAVNVTDIDVGADGEAGTVNIFPTTATKGKAALTCTDQSGDTTVSVVVGAMAAARTITLADPGAAANILTSTGVGSEQIVRCTTQFDAVTGTTGDTLTDVVGMTAQALQVGTYAFRVHVAGVATANSGLKLAFKLTTAVLGVTDYTALGIAAASLVCQHGTTAADQTEMLASTTAILNATIEGTLTVTTAGTIGLQAAQNAAHVDTTSVYVGSYMSFKRIA
ncbi:hypothetical protein KAR91_59800 [Candidatus Pacearchaeota archaeon]|nr:hypothetical protein [Candidatus Pacearchaeota archaeon]